MVAGLLMLLVMLPSGAAAQVAGPQWTAGGTSVAASVDWRTSPVICSNGSGGSITAWTQDFGSWAQGLTGFGTPDSGWSVDEGRNVAPDAPVAPYMQDSPRIVGDGRGGAFVVWHDQRNSGCRYSCWGEYMELFANHINRDGSLAEGWPPAGLPIGSAMNYMHIYAGNQTGAAEDFNTVVAPDGQGGVLIAWQERSYPAFSGAVAGIHAQRVSAEGQLLWGARGVLVAHATGLQLFPAIAATGAGGAALLWQDSRDDSTAFRIYGQRLTPTGTPLWTPDGQPVTRGLIHNEQRPVIAGFARGDLFIGWQAGTTSDSILLCAQRVAASGQLLWPGDVSFSGAGHAQLGLAAAEDASGCLWFAWVDCPSVGMSQIKTQRLDRDGTPTCGWGSDGTAVDIVSSAQRATPQLVAGGSGDAFVVWLSDFSPRASRITASGEVASGWPSDGLGLSLSTWGTNQLAVTSDGQAGALVAWEEGSMPHDDYEIVRVQRLSRSGIWNGLMAALDPVPDSCVSTPKPVFEGFRPNPVRLKAATISFILPAAGAVRIELFDLTGRQLIERDLGQLGSGRHTVPLSASSGTPPGVYFVRMTQSGRSVTTRGVILP